MSLRSDTLLATTGIFPDEITPDEHNAAVAVSGTFARRMRSWVKATEQKPFEYIPPKKDLERLFAQLAVDPDQIAVEQWVEGLGVADPELVADYYTGLLRARKYIVAAWPKFVIGTVGGPSGVQILPLSADDAAEVWTLIQVLDDPDRVLDEMDSFTLTTTQAQAFRTCYPDLFAFADGEARATVGELRAKRPEWGLSWEREGVLNTLRGEPPELPLVPPPPPPAPEAKVEMDVSRDRTQTQVSEAPKAGKSGET